MVSFDRPIPPAGQGPSPLEVAHSLVNQPRFAFFTDKRGVVYCEEVDHRKLVLAALGKTMGGQPTLYREVALWAGNAAVFNDRVKDLYDKGFVIEQDMSYMTPNEWGVQKVLRTVTDVQLGRKLRKLCRAGTPEGMDGGNGLYVVKPNARPLQPFTNIVRARVEGWDISNQAIVKTHFGSMSEEEQAYATKWLKNG